MLSLLLWLPSVSSRFGRYLLCTTLLRSLMGCEGNEARSNLHELKGSLPVLGQNGHRYGRAVRAKRTLKFPALISVSRAPFLAHLQQYDMNSSCVSAVLENFHSYFLNRLISSLLSVTNDNGTCEIWILRDLPSRSPKYCSLSSAD